MDTFGYDVRVIGTRDMPPEKLFARSPTVSVLDWAEFLNLAVSSGFNTTPGSCFSDSRKAYFFGSSMCYMHQFEKSVGELDWETKSKS